MRIWGRHGLRRGDDIRQRQDAILADPPGAMACHDVETTGKDGRPFSTYSLTPLASAASMALCSATMRALPEARSISRATRASVPRS